jgi:hypothetical protein
VPRPPREWNEKELQRDAAEARNLFAQERRAALKDERTDYAKWIAEFTSVARLLLTASNELRDLDGSVLEDRDFLDLARYLTVPPISLDDLDTLTDSCFGLWVGQKTDRGGRPTARAFRDAAKILSDRLDDQRAVWLSQNRAPTKVERETFAAGIASIPAMSRLTTKRRGERSAKQEQLTREAIQAAGYKPAVTVSTLEDPVDDMKAGTFSPKSRRLVRTNMDVPVRLKKSHSTGELFLALECKVSNSSLNSRKRLLEVDSKRQRWDSAGLPHRFRTAAVLAGVFDVERLKETQDSGTYIFWEHRLQDLTAFLKR